ncbi:hypothetical protein BST27_20440 [Mycobacterium intermedium]|uniref:Uncharacterized protein n=1 Tax=Mycobacterium intermedium TaxID=28445 RepID=A0A1E3SL07_MYCIE|nr:hypothetical protein [Mycobacterium intermedium]MCV6963437.1 hypothetical protein [Mycobacterium intermedium]ODR02826.1 hypothetical protein BHQ20_02440 [Mycobacterium intermedium]OPE46898.1 hypothetical protein BV508_24235 [Mycobacterium intermedium]ORA98681.1 hypothetical protein BST27_20440 [Mycobacterium intermedium]
MPNDYRRAVAASCAALAVLALPTVLNIATAQADPLPAFCVPSSVVDNVCTARLTSVTDNVTDGTITGTPVGGGATITLAGQGDAYQKSAGFGDARPALVQEWDDAIDKVSGLPTDPSDPNWYGNAKSKAFLPRTLNSLAAQFPPNILVVRFTPDDAQPGWFRLVSIQPTRQ